MESPPPQLVAPPPKRKRKIRRVLCAIRDLIERLLTPTAIVVIAVLLLVASWIYPPWVSYGRYPQHDWYFIFSTRTGPMRIDLARLLLIDLIIAVLSVLVAWTISRNSAARRMVARVVFYSMVVLALALPTLAIVWGGGVLIQYVQHEVAKRAATQTKRFDPANATLVAPQPSAQSKPSLYDALIVYLARKQPLTVEIPGHGIAEFPAGMSDDKIAAVIKKKFFPVNQRTSILTNTSHKQRQPKSNRLISRKSLCLM